MKVWWLLNILQLTILVNLNLFGCVNYLDQQHFDVHLLFILIQLSSLPLLQWYTMNEHRKENSQYGTQVISQTVHLKLDVSWPRDNETIHDELFTIIAFRKLTRLKFFCIIFKNRNISITLTLFSTL